MLQVNWGKVQILQSLLSPSLILHMYVWEINQFELVKKECSSDISKKFSSNIYLPPSYDESLDPPLVR